MRTLNLAFVAALICLLSACGTTNAVSLSSDRAEAPANTMAECEAPVPTLKTYADAYDAAIINGQRLNECSIMHHGLIQFENLEK